MLSIRERKRKVLVWLIAVLLVISAVIPINTMKVSAASGVTLEKEYWPDNDPAGRSAVGKFIYEGELAFCLEHKKPNADSGSTPTSVSPYENPKVLKTLYYGWTGPGQWSGFKGEESGIVLTSLLLDYYYTGDNHNGATSDGVSYNSFKAYVESQPAPKDDVIGFDKSTVKVHWDVKNQVQKTETVTITAQGASDNDGTTIDFSIPNGVTMVMADGTKKTGSVSVKQGDKFHLEAKASVDGSWSTGNVGHSWKYQALLLTMPPEGGNSRQSLGKLRKIKDPNAQTSLSVKWMDFGSFELTKISETSQLLDGAKFVLKSTDEQTGYAGEGIEYEVKNGKLNIDFIPVGIYTLIESLPPDHHDKPVQSYQVVISKDKKTTQIAVNRLKPTGEIKITKSDEDTAELIEGTEFALYAAEEIYDTVTFKKLYDKGDLVDEGITGKDGICTLKAPAMGKYQFEETKAAPGYMSNNTKYDVIFRQEDYDTKVYYHNKNIENKKTTTEISKIDATTGEEVEGATLQVIDPETNDIVEEWVSTKEAHVIRGLIEEKEYILKEILAPRTHELNETEVRFTVKKGETTKVEMKDTPIKISGQIDKRQTYFGEGTDYKYSIDYRSTSNTWADEFNMIDTIDCAVAGYANVTQIKTPVSFEDWDGKMNVWYKTNKTPASYKEDAEKYNACQSNPENPWNPDNERIQDYTGWKIWKANVSTLKSETLKVSDLKLSAGEYITGIAFEHGRVEKGFTTRTAAWDRSNLKSVDDTIKIGDMPLKHNAVFDLNKANGPTKANQKINYEPAIFYMKVINEKAATDLKEFWNSAEINIYRNLDQHPDLEDHDKDRVVQKYPIGVIEISDKDKLMSHIVKTGDNMRFIIPALALLLILSAAAALFTFNRRKEKEQ